MSPFYQCEMQARLGFQNKCTATIQIDKNESERRKFRRQCTLVPFIFDLEQSPWKT